MSRKRAAFQVHDGGKAIPRKGPATAILPYCHDRIFNSWLQGSTERALAATWQRPRPVIEALVKSKAQERLWQPPANGRRAA